MKESPNPSRWSEESIHESLGHFDWSKLKSYDTPSPEGLRSELDFFKSVGDEVLQQPSGKREEFLRKKVVAGINTFADKIAEPPKPVHLARRKGHANRPISSEHVSAGNQFNRSAPIKMALILELASRLPPPLGSRSNMEYSFGSTEKGEGWGRAIAPMIVTPKETENRELMIKIFAKEATRIIARTKPGDREKMLDGMRRGFQDALSYRLFVEEKSHSSDSADIATMRLTSQFFEALLVEIAGSSSPTESDADTTIGNRKDTVWHRVRTALGKGKAA